MGRRRVLSGREVCKILEAEGSRKFAGAVARRDAEALGECYATMPVPDHFGAQGRNAVQHHPAVWALKKAFRKLDPSPQCLQDAGEIQRIRGEAGASPGTANCVRIKPLAPEVARHHQLRKFG